MSADAHKEVLQITPSDDAPSGEASNTPDDIPEIEEPVVRRRRSRRTRSRREGYASTIGFTAWVVFTVIWLFFFASGYTIFENIGIIIIAMLIDAAFIAAVYIPSVQGRRQQASVFSGIAWIVFMIVWIIFLAGGFGFYENIGAAAASLLFVGLINMFLWMPSYGDSGDARISATAALVWLIFIVLWLPFANDFSATIFPITYYQSISIVLVSLLLTLIAIISPWWGRMVLSIDGKATVGRRPQATVGLVYLWILLLVLWFWFFADTYTGYQNVSAVLISFALFCGIGLAMWYTWTRTRDDSPESWISIGLGFIWIIMLSIWFWFFADSFDFYQNLAVFLASLLGVAGVGGAIQWQRIRDFESLDWEDE